MATRKELMEYHAWLADLSPDRVRRMEKHPVDEYLDTVASENLINPFVNGSVSADGHGNCRYCNEETYLYEGVCSECYRKHCR